MKRYWPKRRLNETPVVTYEIYRSGQLVVNHIKMKELENCRDAIVRGQPGRYDVLRYFGVHQVKNLLMARRCMDVPAKAATQFSGKSSCSRKNTNRWPGAGYVWTMGVAR
jgi:hypothetical protein